MRELLIYTARDKNISVCLKGETVWLSREQMATLLERERPVITKHLRNVFKDGELERSATCAFFAQVQNEGGRTVTRQVENYNLDAILTVGHPVNSKRGVQFCQPGNKDLLIRHIVNLLVSSETNP